MSFIALAAKLKVAMAVAGAATVGAVVGTPAVMSMTASSADTGTVVRPAESPDATPTASSDDTSTSGTSESEAPEPENPESPAPPAGGTGTETEPGTGTQTGTGTSTETPPPTTSTPTSTDLPPCPANIRNHGAYVSSVPVGQRSAAAKSGCGKHVGSGAESEHGDESATSHRHGGKTPQPAPTTSGSHHSGKPHSPSTGDEPQRGASGSHGKSSTSGSTSGFKKDSSNASGSSGKGSGKTHH